MTQKAIHTLARAVVVRDDHILLCLTCKLEKNFYFLPGGHIEHKETAIDALKRELMEEAGEEIMIKRFLGCLENYFEAEDQYYCHNHEYNLVFEAELVKSCDIKVPFKQLEDCIKLIWMPLLKLLELDFRPFELKTIIPIWLSKSDNKLFESTMQ